MAKFTNYLRLAAIACLVFCLCMTFAACDGGDTTTESTAEPTVGSATYTIRVSTLSGIELKNLSVYVYTDATMSELETVKQLDENGSATFEATIADYVAVVMGVPEGYDVQEYYTFDAQKTADIVLKSSVITGKEKPEDKIYALGDVMYDFTITASDGTTYTLSELLQEKEAVVLNFWYLNCPPCKLEFPYLEMAYGEYSDRIEVLAINCEDGNNEELNKFSAENELTFPMAIGDKDYWYPAAYTACPTTMIVDRYGMIVYMHTGYFDNVATFNAMFRLVTGDNYEQTLIQDIESLVTEDDYRPDGTEAHPFEMGGSTEFDVKVPANGKVYYNLYRLDNVTMRIENPDAYVIVDGITHYPENGVIELKVSCPDTFAPLTVVFGNSSASKNTIHVQYVFEPGNVNNPIELILGENNVTVNNVNGLGVYYTYTAATSGTLVLTVEGCTEQATPDIHLYNNNTYESVYLSSDGKVNEETGLISLSITVNAGDEIQIIFSASTDPEIVLSTVTIKALASIMEGEGNGVIDGRTGYTITVVDQDGNPVPGVKLSLSAGSQSAVLSTDEAGNISVRLTENAYFLEMIVPSGYVADTTSYLWSPAKTHLDIRIVAVRAVNLRVQRADGIGLSNVLVKIYASAALDTPQYVISTDANGMLTFLGRADIAYYAVLSGVEPGLHIEESYLIEGTQTVITLRAAEEETTLGLSDEMPNFAITDIDGTTHALNALLQEKDLVVLTFWRTTSVPSVQNMVNLQQLYGLYGDRVAFLALNPVETLEIELAMFRSIHGLTYPLALCDEAMTDRLGVSNLPTTVVIDREGKICLIQDGVISQDAYIALFELCLAEDYVHTPIEDINTLPGITPAEADHRKRKY